MTRVGLVAAALSTLAGAGLFAGAAGGHDDPTVCMGQLSGVSVERLVVPAGQTCTAADVTVDEDVRVRRDATLEASNIVVGEGVRVASGGALSVSGSHVDIGGDVIAHDVVSFDLARDGVLGSTFRVRGDVVAGGAEQGVAIFGITIDGDVRVHHSGAENGVGIGGNVIGGSAAVVDNTIVGAERPSAIDVFENSVGENLIVSRNDAIFAFEPTFVGSNVVLRGDLVCRHNIPDVVNDPPGGPYPNTVVEGKKLGQCADL
jgi:hypothetical protein